jgi:hypothetical protein
MDIFTYALKDMIFFYPEKSQKNVDILRSIK